MREDLTRHGVAAPRGLAVPPDSRGGRFGRMFPELRRPDPGVAAIEQLARMLIARAGPSDEGTIPAGYTYLAQFIDHDLTFDPASKLQRTNDPDALVDFRTPRFDLDSVYGSGPVDEPFLYDWKGRADPGVKLLVGRNPAGGWRAARDLPRNEQGRALIADARNDENLIVSQLHLLFLRFHNRVVDLVRRRRPRPRGAELFEEAQRIVRWHYQWIVTHDVLKRIVGADLADAAHRGRRFFVPRGEPFMPVEFSAAAFRFGHSMVRPDYVLNHRRAVPILLPPGVRGTHLGGFRPLPGYLEIEWPHFFKTTPVKPKMRAMPIDTVLAPPLSHLPPDDAALARLNLERGRALGLPAGRDVANAICETPLSASALALDGSVRGLDESARAALLDATPLWYYVLCEAEAEHRADREHLGPVGGTIVAEVLVGLLESDPSSYARQQPDWTPDLADDHDFTMADLVRFTDPAQASTSG